MVGSVRASHTRPVKTMSRTYIGSSWRGGGGGGGGGGG